MELNDQKREEWGEMSTIHRILAHSYTLHLVGAVVGFVLYAFFPTKTLVTAGNEAIGIIFMLFGTLLILWAQTASDKTKVHRKDKENLKHHHFAVGPYAYFRSPTNQGLFMMLLGFGFLLGSIAFIATAMVTYLLARFIFIEKEENILTMKYGSVYEEYKNKTKL